MPVVGIGARKKEFEVPTKNARKLASIIRTGIRLKQQLVEIGQEILTTLGYRVETTTSSLEAIERFKAAPDQFDLIVSDLTMPKMTGEVLAREAMRIRPDIPVILFTGYSDIVSREKFVSLGIKDCLMKPLTRKDLAESIRRVLDEHPAVSQTPPAETSLPGETDDKGH